MSDNEEEFPHKKKIKVAAASLIDLKAELAKKREQFNREKLQNVPRARPQKPPDIKNKGVEARNQRDLSELQLDKDELEESRKALEKKSKLYDELKSNALKQDDDTPFLVDFEQKAVNQIAEERRELEEKVKEESSESELSDFNDEPKDPSDDWVEFVDALGRSRVCLRRDLPHYKKIDDKLKEKPKVENESEIQSIPQTIFQPKVDVHHERLKDKWSKTEEETKNAAHVHYENIRFDEIRNHGTGFYRFSTDEQTRNEQRRILDELRDKTVRQRKTSEIFRAKRKTVMKERLKKVRRRKRIRMGLDPEVSEEEEESSESDEDPLEIPVREIQLPEPKKENPMREWDIGKTPMGIEQVWAKKKEVLRSEREEEFAPPSFY